MITFYERNTAICLANFRMVRVMSSVESKHDMSKTFTFLSTQRIIKSRRRVDNIKSIKRCDDFYNIRMASY